MTSADLTPDLIEHLASQERVLLRKHRVRLRVDKITVNGSCALCSVYQTRHSFFRPLLSDPALASLAHRFLMKLNNLGLQTLVSAVPKGPLTTFKALDRNDPFNLCTAQSAVRSGLPIAPEQMLASFVPLAKVS